MDGRQSHNKQHGDAVPKKARDMFLCFLHIKIKKARQARFSTAGYVCSTKTRVGSHPAVLRERASGKTLGGPQVYKYPLAWCHVCFVENQRLRNR